MTKRTLKIAKATTSVVLASVFAACGGGGGGGGGVAAPVYYPYETVYGDICTTTEPTPGCTFNRSTGTRVNVAQDPDYNKYGFGSDDLWYVKFYSNGTADVYNDFGVYQYTTSTSSFAGYIGGNTIGVGTTGLFWENVSGGTYWLGKNGVLYNAMPLESNYGKAINNKDANEASDTNFAALATDANKSLVKAGAEKLVKDYGMQADKAHAVASALNTWAVAAAERGYTTAKDIDKTFTAVFGVEYSSAIAAVKDLAQGEKAQIREVTNRVASALGFTSARDAEKFMKGMFNQAAADWGFNMDNLTW